MALTAGQLSTLKRRSGESHKTAQMISDIDFQLIADESGLVVDADGNGPLDADYTETYDLYAAAGTAWEEKAAMTAEGFDFSAEGGSFTRSQHYRHCVEQGQKMRGRQSNLSA